MQARGKVDRLGGDGCTCKPTFYVISRDERGKPIREKVGKNKRNAERARDRIAVAVDDGSYVPQQNIGFNEWGARWLKALERKGTTVNSYRSTVGYASEVFGPRPVRRLGAQDIARFNEHLLEIGSGGRTAKAAMPRSRCRLRRGRSTCGCLAHA